MNKHEIVNKAVGPKCKVLAELLLDALEANQYDIELDMEDDPVNEDLVYQSYMIGKLQSLAFEIYKGMGISIDKYDRPEDHAEFNEYWEE